MLYSGRFNLICLITGMLALGEVGVQALPASDVINGAEEVQSQVVAEAKTDEQWKIEYQNLEEEERSCRERLQEKEAELKAGGEVSQIEIMNLNEELRTIQLQKMILKSKME